MTQVSYDQSEKGIRVFTKITFSSIWMMKLINLGTNRTIRFLNIVFIYQEFESGFFSIYINLRYCGMMFYDEEICHLWDAHLNLYGIFVIPNNVFSKSLTITEVSVSYHELHHTLKGKTVSVLFGHRCIFAAVRAYKLNAV